MHEALKSFFEEQIAFRLQDDTAVEGSVYIGETEFLPVETLRDDKDAYQAEFNAWLDEMWIPEQLERRNQILTLHANAKRYADLRDAVARRQVVPLIGSGMSSPSGLPTWSDLLRAIRAFTKIDPAVLEGLLMASAFEEAADLIASATSANLLNERIEHELRIDNPAVLGGAVRLLPAMFPDLVITTNLDDVLEQHYRRCGVEFNEVLSGQDIARYRGMKTPTRRFLLKLHGDCRRAETRVLRKGEYEAAYALGSVVREELALLYRTNHLLFLGCSLGPDRTVGLIAEVAASDKSMPKHFALLPLPESDPVRVDRENFLCERGIYAIWYDGAPDESIRALLAGLLGVTGVGGSPAGAQ
jgi:hypothetical protein